MAKSADPAPGSGVNYDPNEEDINLTTVVDAPPATEPEKPEEAPAPIPQAVISPSAAAAGITPPASPTPATPNLPGTFVQPLSDEELYDELDAMTLNEFVRKHTEDNRANIDTMARVARLNTREIVEIQRELGFPLPEGA